MITFFDGLQAVGNDNQRLFAMETIDGIHNCCLRVIVQRGSRLIQYQYLRIVVKYPGDTDTLAYSPGI